MVPSTFGRRQRIDKTITSSTSSSSTPRVDSRPPSTTTSIHRGSIELRCRRCSGEWVPGFLPGSSSFGPYGGVTDVVIVDEKKTKKIKKRQSNRFVISGTQVSRDGSISRSTVKGHNAGVIRLFFLLLLFCCCCCFFFGFVSFSTMTTQPALVDHSITGL